MNCEDARFHLHDFVKRRLDPALNGEVGAHLEGCAACSSAERAEHVLDELLEQRLPRYAAPNAFKRRLGLLVGRPASARVEPRRWTRVVARRWRRDSFSSQAACSCPGARVSAASSPP